MIIALLVSFVWFAYPHNVTAYSTYGTILPGYTYAWSNNSGWVNFGLASGNVQVLDTKLTGYAWAANHGWINLAPSTGGVTNDGTGNLGGWAWGEQLGWISFSGVTIDAAGRFHGKATGALAGTITFDCDYCDVRTDWRPTSTSSGGPVPPQSLSTTSTVPAATSTSPAATSTPPVNPLENAEPPAPEPEPTPMPPTHCEMYPSDPQCAGTPPGFCASNPSDPRCQPLAAKSLCDTNLSDPACAKSNSASPGETNDVAAPTTPGTLGQQIILRSRAAILATGHIRQHLAENLQIHTQPVVTGVATAVGVGAAVGGNVVVLYTGLGGFPELHLILLRLIQNVMAVLGLRRKRRYWGIVFDSTTKQPLDPVVVELRDAKTNRLLEQAITDLMGRYGFLSREGTFIITAQKTHYRFPSRAAIRPSDPVFDRLYRGEPILVTGSDVLAPNIPMDPLAPDWNEQQKLRFLKFHPYREVLLHFLFSAVFALGFVWTILVAILVPSSLNFLCLVFYLFILVLRRLLPHERLWGRIYDAKSKTVLSDMLLELRPLAAQVVIARSRTGADGRFFLRAPPGKYHLLVYRDSASPDTDTLYKQTTVTLGKNGLLNQNIGL